MPDVDFLTCNTTRGTHDRNGYSSLAYPFSSKLLSTTETLEKAIANPANSGLRTRPKAG